MSFILDALKKSEADRHKTTGPGVYELKVPAPRARFPVWALIVALLLGINLLVGLWYLIKTDQPTPIVRSEAPPAAANPVPAPAPAPAPITAAVTATPAMPSDDDTGRTDVARGIYNPADFEPAIDPAAPTTTPAPPVVRPAPRTGTNNTPPQTRSFPESAMAAPPARRPATQGLPSRDDLALEGIPVPEVSMSLHVYDANPAKRFAFVNGNRAQEGDALPNGIRVESITPDGAILTWQNRRFLLALP
jgi:general secretion pathway protein B